MRFFASWTARPVTALMVLAVVLAVAGVALSGARLGPAADQGQVTYAVIIEYYGVDAGRIERDITQPLENAVAAVPGIDELSSVSEYGKSRLTITLSAAARKDEVYLLLRDAVDRVHAQLPAAVQKPVIVSSSREKRPVFIVAFRAEGMERTKLNQLVEREVKPAFERIEGAGEIDVGGGEVREIHITVKAERVAQTGLSLQDLARALDAANVLQSVGELRGRLRAVPLTVKGNLESLEELRNLLIDVPGSAPEKLGSLAEVGYGVREKQSIARVNGEEQTTVYVESSGSANLVSLSRALREETERWRQHGLAPEVILDTGGEIEDSLHQVLNAIIAGVILVVALLAASSGHPRQVLVLSLLIPAVCLATLGLLSLLRVNIDTFVLAGLAVGIGNVVDGAIVLTEACRSRRAAGLSRPELSSLREVIPALISSVLTTLVVLVPLFFLGGIMEGIRAVTVSVGLLMIVSLLFTVLFVPPFFLPGDREKERPPARFPKARRLARLIGRIVRRFFYAAPLFVMRQPKRFLLGSAGFLSGSLLLAALMGKDLSGIGERGVIYAHFEFDSGDSVETCDRRSALFIERLKDRPGVERAETNSRFGSTEMVVRFNAEILPRALLIEVMKAEGAKIPNGFLYLPEPGGSSARVIEVAVTGDDNRTLRELAGAAAQRLGAELWVEQVVLHFKEGPPLHVFSTDRAALAHYGLSTAEVADGLRWAVHGPVALKWVEKNQELDVRVRAARENVSSIGALNRTAFRPPRAGPGGLVRLEQLGDFSQTREESKIYRKNRQRAVFMTVHTRDLDLEAAAQRIRQTLAGVALPPGYAFELDESAARLSDQFRLLWLLLLLALALIYMILASQSESFTLPLLVSATVPLSLAFPLIALFLAGQPITIPALIGLVILSGMAVNNSLLIVELVREDIRRRKTEYTPRAMIRPVLFALRRRFRDLLLTSATSVFGALPLLGLSAGDSGMLSSLSFIVFWGIIGSLAVTVFFLPALATAFPRLLKPFALGDDPDVSGEKQTNERLTRKRKTSPKTKKDKRRGRRS